MPDPFQQHNTHLRRSAQHSRRARNKMQEPGFTAIGWATLPPTDGNPGPQRGAWGNDEDPGSFTGRDGSMAAAAAGAAADDAIARFLHASASHQLQPSASLSSAASLDLAEVTGTALHNPFAQPAAGSSSRGKLQQHHQDLQPPAAPALQQQQPYTAHAASRRGVGRPRRPLLRRLLRGLLLTGTSAGLLAAGAWAGSAAYKHYMAQLDDRCQLAAQVEALRRTEHKLLHRCMAVEAERDRLAGRASELSGALADGQAAQGKLKQQLALLEGERDDAVRFNLNLQRKLTALEEVVAGLAEDKAALADALAGARSEAQALGGQLGKLEQRCVALADENERLSSAAESYKTQAAKLAVLSHQ